MSTLEDIPRHIEKVLDSIQRRAEHIALFDAMESAGVRRRYMLDDDPLRVVGLALDDMPSGSKTLYASPRLYQWFIGGSGRPDLTVTLSALVPGVGTDQEHCWLVADGAVTSMRKDSADFRITGLDDEHIGHREFEVAATVDPSRTALLINTQNTVTK